MSLRLLCVLCLCTSLVFSTIQTFSALEQPIDYQTAFVMIGKFVANASLTVVPMMKSKCRTALLSVVANPMSTDESYNFVMYSGKRINDLGDYLSCYRSSVSRYIMASAISKSSSISYGICAPSDCDVSDFEPLAPSLLAVVQDIYPEWENITVRFWDVKAENIRATNDDAGYTICEIITFSLIAIVAVATAIDLHSNPPQNIIKKVINCFSAPVTIKAMFETKNKVDSNLDVLHGIRVLAMCWITMGQSYSYVANSRVYNGADIKQTATHDFSMAFTNLSTVAADIFFCLSGFLAALTFYQVLEKGGVVSVLLAYIKRYIRLFPFLAITMMCVATVLEKVKDEPFTPEVKHEIDNCKNNWYMTLFYVGNFVKPDKVCMSWSWYLMNDMQFFILAPIFVGLFIWSQIAGLLAILVASLASMVTQAIIFTTYELNSSYNYVKNDYMDLYYTKPYCRIVTYLLGILLFFLYSAHKKNEEEGSPSLFKRIAKSICTSAFAQYFLYFLGIIFMVITLIERFILDRYPESWGQSYATYFEITFRPMFIIGLICILLPPMLGCGEIMQNIFGCSLFTPWSKVTYAVYLIHPVTFLFLYGYTLNGHFFTHYNTWLLGMCCTLFAGYAFGFFGEILYEGPVLQLMKLVSSSSSDTEKKVTTNTDEKTEPMLTAKE